MEGRFPWIFGGKRRIEHLVLERELPEIRAGLLQLAARLDGLDRAGVDIAADPRMQAVRRGVEVLTKLGAGRAEQIQLIFSRPYEEDWKRTLEVKTR